MTVSNPLFLTVSDTSTTPGSGFEVLVYPLTDLAHPLAVITEYTALTFMVELSGVGAGSVSMDDDSPMWNRRLRDGRPMRALRDGGFVWEVRIDGIIVAQWLSGQVDETRENTDATHSVVVAGPGTGAVLTWAKIMPPNFPAAAVKPNAPLSWGFTSKTPAMSIFGLFLRAAKARGVCSFVTPTFTDTHDSAGMMWADVAHPYTRPSNLPYAPELGTDLLTALNVATGVDPDQATGMRAEWVMWPGFRLDARPTVGVHRETQVIFGEPAVLGVDRTRVRDAIANTVAIRDLYGGISIATDTVSEARWGRRELLQVRANFTDPPRRRAIAANQLAALSQEKSSWTISVPYNSPRRRPFINYHLGDWVGIDSVDPATGVSTVDAYRVMAIAVSVDATNDSAPTVELTLQSALDAYSLTLQRRLTAIVNSVVNGAPPVIHVPAGTSDNSPLVYDAATNTWGPGTWGAGAGLPPVFIQPTDPGTAAPVGYLWYQT